ncbi:hypothetical protein H0H92_009941 [Tricholoma furcatifolium]|nr:hypothetical protein H0H92_009941 [Tricholoma furcatifolium]
MAGPHAPGFNPHLPGFKYSFLAKGLGATMWFFIFYRARSGSGSSFAWAFSDLFNRQDGGKLLRAAHFRLGDGRETRRGDGARLTSGSEMAGKPAVEMARERAGGVV